MNPGTLVFIVGALTMAVLGFISLMLLVDFIVRFVLSVIMIRHWRREEQR